MMKLVRMSAVVLTIAAAAATLGNAQAVRGGFNSTGFPGNDDGSVGPVSFGFTLNFFGTPYTNGYVNNNGNLTFNTWMSTYTPFPIVGNGMPMIAPFFADVDTRTGPLTAYGAGTVGSRNAWGITWPGVCYYSVNCSRTNIFQLVLIDRSDIALGDFDIEFNYDQVQWETGDASNGVGGLGGYCARAGWTDGATHEYELTGSATCGAYVDGGAYALSENSLNSAVTGRYVFTVRSGQVNVVPEPMSIVLLGTGLIGVGIATRRRSRNG